MRLRRPAAALLVLLAAALPPRGASADWPVTRFTLDNGLKVVVIEDDRAPVVTHMVAYRVGGADEPEGRSGLAHWLEHLMFKDADGDARGGFSAAVAAEGGVDNAFTSQDVTAYFQEIAADRLPLMMEMEAERMRSLEVEAGEAATERDVVLEERAQRIDNDPGARLAEQRTAALYLNHPYGDPLVGWRHEIAALTLEDALAFHRRFYAPDNAVLVVAGDVTPDAVRKLAAAHYGDIPAAGAPPRARPTEPPHTAPRRVLLQDARVRQPYVVRDHLAPARRGDQAEAAALTLLAAVLGDGLNSRLQQALVAEGGPALAAGASYLGSPRDHGEFTVYAVPKPGVGLDEIETALDAALAAFLASEGPTAEELERAKTKWRAAWIYALDNRGAAARRWAMGLAKDLTPEQIEGWPAALEAVDAAAVMAAARAVLRPETSVTARLSAPPPPAAPVADAPEGEG